MLPSSLKPSQKYSHLTPALSSIHSDSINNQKHRHPHSKRESEMSILQKLNSNKLRNIEDIDISGKIVLYKGPSDSRSKYFVLGQDDIVGESSKIRTRNQPYKYNQVQDKLLTFSPLALKQHKNSQSSANLLGLNSAKQNALSKTPSRQRFQNPTESWTQKITPQKSAKKQKPHHHKLSVQQRQPFAPLTIHQQLYLQSRKKQLKRSAEQIIENEYFKKVHPFKPTVSQFSEFLAEQKRSKIKERQQFESEFQEFSESRLQKNLRKSKAMQTKRSKKDTIDIEKAQQSHQKQTELKNYTLLKQFFFHLSENSPLLTYTNLTPKKLCELPSPCIKLLQPILEDFYKNKHGKKLSWLEFLSEFNIKVEKRKSFYSLVQKWFWVKYKLRFDRNCKESFHDESNRKIGHEQASTYIGNQNTLDDHGSRIKLKRVY